MIKFELLENLKLKDQALVPDLLCLSIGHPSPERLRSVIDSYSGNSRRVLLIAKISQKLVGCIGLDIGENQKLAILHIAVSPEFQKRGIGKALISESIRRFSPIELAAETDDEAIEFYRKSGFDVIENFQSEWKIQRYRVHRDLVSKDLNF